MRFRAGVGACALAVATLVIAGSAHATAPGINGAKIAFGSGEIFVMNTDGSGVVNLTNTPLSEHREMHPTWSPDGLEIAFADNPDDDPRFQVIERMNADGTGRTSVGGWFNESAWPDWSPGGEEIAFGSCESSGEFEIPCNVAARAPNGTGARQIIGPDAHFPSWSPDGKRIVFTRADDLYIANSDGTGITPLTTTAAREQTPDWSPDGAKILFTRSTSGEFDLYTVKPDGSDLQQLTSRPGFDSLGSWSPDGTRILFNSDRDGEFGGIYSMKPDGTEVQRIGTATGSGPVWQPIPVNAYPRPKGASPTDVPLVPAYEPCTAPNRTHGPPLAFPSCAPPEQKPGQLTVGTPDANGQPAKLRANIRINPLRGLPSTPADEADVRLRATVNDVRLRSDLSDYTGNLEVRLTVQITDKDNTPHPGGPGPATVQELTHSHPLPCATTPADTTVGSTCQFDTTVEAVVPGAVKELTRGIWELKRIAVHDGAGNLFLTQGIFVP